MKPTAVIIMVSLMTAILLPIVLTPWKIPQIGQAKVELANYDFSSDCWHTRVGFRENELPQIIVIFSPVWNPSKGENLYHITNSPSTWGDVTNPKDSVPRLVKAGLRIVGQGSVYQLLLCKRGEIAWEIVALEVLLPLFAGGVVLLIRKRKR
jgi:hypothetical protein